MTETRDMYTHEKIVCVWIGPANLEQLHEIVELAVDVSAHRYWAFLGRFQCPH